MRGHNPQRTGSQIHVDHQRAARLDSGQPHLVDIADRAFAHQEKIAVPSVAAGPAVNGCRNKAALAFQAGEVQKASPIAKPLLSLLKSDDVGVELTDHGGDARGVEALVGADALMHVVRRDERSALPPDA